jgi:polyhydroxyalkanoate synthesis repressor PhaR
MTQPKLIRKYVNRRLYDTSQSRYVNLHDLREQIVEGAEIRVIDQSNDRDITSTVLLKIIAEIQQSGTSLLTVEFLADLIRLAAAEGRDPELPGRLRTALRAAIQDMGTQGRAVVELGSPPSVLGNSG